MVSKFKKIVLTTAAVAGLAVTSKWIDKVHAEPIQISTSCYVVECKNLDPRSCSEREIPENRKESEMLQIQLMRETNHAAIAAVQCYRNECEHRAHHVVDWCLHFEVPKKEKALKEEPIRSFLEDQSEHAENRMLFGILCFMGLCISPIIMAEAAEKLLRKINKWIS